MEGNSKRVSTHALNPRHFDPRIIINFHSYGPQGVTQTSFSLLEWSEDSKVQGAWKELAEKHGLLLDPFKDAARRAQIFAMSDSAIIGGWALSLSMRKARKMGFHGSVDSYESAFHTLRDLSKLKVLPPLAVTEYVE